MEFELSGRQTETRERNPKARLTLDPCHRRVGAALALAGIGTSQLHPLGFADQETVLNLVALTESLVNKPLELQPAIVITQPYEGGHPDHDSTAFAVHTACEILLKEQGVAPIIVEATSYFNRAGIMATSEFLPRARSDIKTFALAEAERAFKRRLFACFRTQQNVLQYFPLAIERFRASFDFTAPPHPGKLYYKLFNGARPASVGASWPERPCDG
ncbi:MAG TPA: PIG-L family deacetylase [Candidatus Paceibacterota bacterium]|nr:PIG-L family deacetylase [Candidatus Paceibacterota bacterium]